MPAGRVVGSIRAVTAEARKAAVEKIWSEIEVGKKYHGVVKSLTLLWRICGHRRRGRHGPCVRAELGAGSRTPAEVVKVGDEIEVYVISFRPREAEDLPGLQDGGDQSLESSSWTSSPLATWFRLRL